MKSFKTFNLSEKPIKIFILMKIKKPGQKKLYFDKFPKMFDCSGKSSETPVGSLAGGFQGVLLKTEKDFCHRKGPKRTFGHRKGLRYGMPCYKKLMLNDI